MEAGCREVNSRLLINLKGRCFFAGTTRSGKTRLQDVPPSAGANRVSLGPRGSRLLPALFRRRLEDSPHEVGEQSEYQKHKCGDPDQEVSCQLWGLDFFFIHGTRILPFLRQPSCGPRIVVPLDTRSTDLQHRDTGAPSPWRFGADGSGRGLPRSPATVTESLLREKDVVHAV
jgi:hypothetical protein